MARNVGLLYGKPRVKKLSILAGTVANSISLSYMDKTIVHNATISTEVAPLQTITIEANIPNASISSNRLYHNGDEPSEGNYYYNEVTNYQFDKWIDKNGSTISTSVRYEFQMPVYDETITAIGSIYMTEANKTNAIKVSAINVDTTNISGVKINDTSGDHDTYIYKWPEDNVVLSAIPKADSVDTTTYRYGPNGVNGSPIADAGNTRWYMRTNHYANSITDSNGVTYSGNNISLTPNSDITYSFRGSSNTVRTSITNAKSVAITASGLTSGGLSTYKTSGYTQKWYWDNSTENNNTTQYTKSSSWSTTINSLAYLYDETSESRKDSLNVSISRTNYYGNKSTFAFNGGMTTQSETIETASAESNYYTASGTRSIQNGASYTSVSSTQYIMILYVHGAPSEGGRTGVYIGALSGSGKCYSHCTQTLYRNSAYGYIFTCASSISSSVNGLNAVVKWKTSVASRNSLYLPPVFGGNKTVQRSIWAIASSMLTTNQLTTSSRYNARSYFSGSLAYYTLTSNISQTFVTLSNENATSSAWYLKTLVTFNCDPYAFPTGNLSEMMYKLFTTTRYGAWDSGTTTDLVTTDRFKSYYSKYYHADANTYSYTSNLTVSLRDKGLVAASASTYSSAGFSNTYTSNRITKSTGTWYMTYQDINYTNSTLKTNMDGADIIVYNKNLGSEMYTGTKVSKTFKITYTSSAITSYGWGYLYRNSAYTAIGGGNNWNTSFSESSNKPAYL